MELGVAGTIRTIELISSLIDMDHLINDWLINNPDVEVIEIQYRGKSALIIYRKEG